MCTKARWDFRRFSRFAGAAVFALIVGIGGMAVAQDHGGGGGGREFGGGGGGGHDHGSGGQKRIGRNNDRAGGGHQSLRDVFKQLEGQSAIEELRDLRGQRGGQSATASGRGGGRVVEPSASAEEPSEDSRPYWAGNSGRSGGGASGTGDLYGDLYLVVRDENGVPILKSPVEGAPELLQVYYLNDEGELDIVPYVFNEAENEYELDPAYTPAEAVFSRASVVRSPDRVLENQYAEFVNLWNEAVAVTLDDTSRLILEMEDGTTSSIDSPLIYLALYERVLTTGTLPDAIERSGTAIELDLSKLPAELSSLGDDGYDLADLAVTANFLSAAMDKSGTATTDMIVYLNAILGVATEDNAVTPDSDFVKYEDFTYSRDEVYDGKTITIQVEVEEEPGTWVTQTVPILGTVFPEGETFDGSGVVAYTQAVDDARAVIDYVHTYAPPEAK